MAFDEISDDAFSEEALEFRMLMLHYMSLMHAVYAPPSASREPPACPPAARLPPLAAARRHLAGVSPTRR